MVTGGMWGGRIHLFSIDNERMIKEFKWIHNSTVTAMDFDDKSRCFVTGCKTGAVCFLRMS